MAKPRRNYVLKFLRDASICIYCIFVLEWFVGILKSRLSYHNMPVSPAMQQGESLQGSSRTAGGGLQCQLQGAVKFLTWFLKIFKEKAGTHMLALAWLNKTTFHLSFPFSRVCVSSRWSAFQKTVISKGSHLFYINCPLVPKPLPIKSLSYSLRYIVPKSCCQFSVRSCFSSSDLIALSACSFETALSTPMTLTFFPCEAGQISHHEDSSAAIYSDLSETFLP